MKPTTIAKLAGILLLLAVLILITLFLVHRTSTEPARPLASGPETRPAGEPLFTLSPETTALTSPLHSDGAPDYVAALNARYGQGVTPENNAFAAWIELIGTGKNSLPVSVSAAILSMAGAKPSDARWVSFDDYCAKHNHPEKGAESSGDDEEQLAAKQPWKDDQFPLVADFLKERGPVLDQAKQAWSRSRYWLPAVSNNGRSVYGVLLPGLGVARDLAKSLAARAMQRAGTGDFDGYLSDILTLKNMSRLFFTGSTTIERLVAAAIESEMDRVIAASAAAGIFSAIQCQRLSEALDPLPPHQNNSETIDCTERWGALDETLLIATGQADSLQKMMDAKEYHAISTIDPDSVDWDVILKQLNANADQWVHATQQLLLEDMQAAGKSIKSNRSLPGTTRDLSPTGDESRTQYTARITAALSQMLTPDLTRAEELCREAHMQYAMARALVAAAHHHAVTGQWPRSLQELIPAELDALPIDIYIAGGKDPVHYLLTAAGPTLYSIGRNRIDDGGLRNASGQDDLAVGTPLTAPTPPSDAPPLP